MGKYDRLEDYDAANLQLENGNNMHTWTRLHGNEAGLERAEEV